MMLPMCTRSCGRMGWPVARSARPATTCRTERPAPGHDDHSGLAIGDQLVGRFLQARRGPGTGPRPRRRPRGERVRPRPGHRKNRRDQNSGDAKDAAAGRVPDEAHSYLPNPSNFHLSVRTDLAGAELGFYRWLRILSVRGSHAEVCVEQDAGRGQGPLLRADQNGIVGSQAAGRVGVSLSCGSLWFIDAGSVSFIETPVSPRYLSQDDRIEIADGLACGEPVR